MGGENSFYERQRFAPWVDALILVSAGGVVAGIWFPYFALGEKGFLATRAALVSVISTLALLLTMNLLGMTTTMERDALVVRFGRWFTLYRKRFEFREIQAARAVTYRPLRDAGGWGIRFGRFEGNACRFLNCRGDKGVLLSLHNGKPCIIGSQQPADLEKALQEVLSWQSH